MVSRTLGSRFEHFVNCYFRVKIIWYQCGNAQIHSSHLLHLLPSSTDISFDIQLVSNNKIFQKLKGLLGCMKQTLKRLICGRMKTNKSLKWNRCIRLPTPLPWLTHGPWYWVIIKMNASGRLSWKSLTFNKLIQGFYSWNNENENSTQPQNLVHHNTHELHAILCRFPGGGLLAQEVNDAALPIDLVWVVRRCKSILSAAVLGQERNVVPEHLCNRSCCFNVHIGQGSKHSEGAAAWAIHLHGIQLAGWGRVGLNGDKDRAAVRNLQLYHQVIVAEIRCLVPLQVLQQVRSCFKHVRYILTLK